MHASCAGEQSIGARRSTNNLGARARGVFPPTMPLGQFLFEYLYRCGVRHSFGIPGDFALPTFAALDKSKIKNVTMTHEPSAGFAADAYARINGIGLVCVTYCVGDSTFSTPSPARMPKNHPWSLSAERPAERIERKIRSFITR